MKSAIRVLLVDDHAVVRAGFRMLLSAGAHEVVGEASRGEEAMALFEQLKPDILVMDLSMPGIGGLETIRRIIQREGAARILVFSVHHEQVYVQRALEAGAKGYITKNSAPSLLGEAMETIMAGGQYVERSLIKSSAGSHYPISQHSLVIDELSAREFDIFRLLAKGLTVQRIADELCLGQKTVANYATQIRKKLNVSTTAELAHIAVSLDLL